jgi:hypothetical protein
MLVQYRQVEQPTRAFWRDERSVFVRDFVARLRGQIKVLLPCPWDDVARGHGPESMGLRRELIFDWAGSPVWLYTLAAALSLCAAIFLSS